MNDPTSAHWERLDRAFEEAIAPVRDSPAPISLLFSGGVDSSLLAWELRRRPELELVVVGAPESPDIVQATQAATRLGRPLTVRPLTGAEIGTMERRLAAALVGTDSVRRSVAVTLALAIESARCGPVVVGQGSDELFLGYQHFVGLSPEDALARARSVLDLLCREEWPRALRIAEELGHRLLAPYLERVWIEAANAVPIEARLPTRSRKELFRSWAEHRGLPRTIARAPKRAMQYGSRVHQLRARGARGP